MAPGMRWRTTTVASFPSEAEGYSCSLASSPSFVKHQMTYSSTLNLRIAVFERTTTLQGLGPLVSSHGEDLRDMRGRRQRSGLVARRQKDVGQRFNRLLVSGTLLQSGWCQHRGERARRGESRRDACKPAASRCQGDRTYLCVTFCPLEMMVA